MTRRQPRPRPSFDQIRHKIGEAHFFLQHLKHHRDQQRQPAKPPLREFSYHLSAFLSAARSVGKLLERLRPNWWKQLGTEDQALHGLFWKMRGDATYEGEVRTKCQTQEVTVRPDFSNRDYLRVQGFLFSDIFGLIPMPRRIPSM